MTHRGQGHVQLHCLYCRVVPVNGCLICSKDMAVFLTKLIHCCLSTGISLVRNSIEKSLRLLTFCKKLESCITVILYSASALPKSYIWQDFSSVVHIFNCLTLPQNAILIIFFIFSSAFLYMIETFNIFMYTVYYFAFLIKLKNFFTFFCSLKYAFLFSYLYIYYF